MGEKVDRLEVKLAAMVDVKPSVRRSHGKLVRVKGFKRKVKDGIGGGGYTDDPVFGRIDNPKKVDTKAAKGDFIDDPLMGRIEAGSMSKGRMELFKHVADDMRKHPDFEAWAKEYDAAKSDNERKELQGKLKRLKDMHRSAPHGVGRTRLERGVSAWEQLKRKAYG